ncbi:hypothetical protein KUTeg_020306 [Tegillarca granosa]|uniref:Superoxide dismutase copper/zinc binding domain-containing protein n=1 Tax=Tegillarca granosa TaxID=220873 RepID=A0ABQ9EA42_TEGGR|nr:hypothetical protein KUTeg_020306 [Tegillarca granosa]
MERRNMKLAVFFCVAMLVLADSVTGKKPKRPKPSKKIPPHIDMKFEHLSNAIGQLQQNVSALWMKLDQMSGMERQSSGGVHIHARDGHVEHIHHEHDEGQHLHMHMHIDSECDHRGHDHDGRRHHRMHAHANRQGPLHVDINLTGFDVSGDHAHHVHGFHIHEFGDLTDGCGSLGGHYDVTGSDHGAPDAENRHTGDFGNIMCNDEGIVEKHFTDDRASLVGKNSIFGRSIVEDTFYQSKRFDKK